MSFTGFYKNRRLITSVIAVHKRLKAPFCTLLFQADEDVSEQDRTETCKEGECVT